MASLDVKSIENQVSGSLELDPAIFEAEIRRDLFHAEVRRQLAARRTGTHSSLNRAGVSGGGAKPYRQKGTGRARQGTIRAPQWAGGGAVFGPVPRGYGHKLPKKVRAAALRSALSLRHSEEAVTVVTEFSFDSFKTKAVSQVLQALELGGASVLVVIDEPDEFLEVSARNLPGVSVVRAEGLNVYDVLRHKQLLVTQAAMGVIGERLARSANRSES
jgi:large subunit ribosomal protein L4